MGAKVTVGVCGGVAAYRAVELVRALQEAGMDPHVVMTAGAAEFVTALTFAAISGHRVISSLWSGGEVPVGADGARSASSVEHIQEAQTSSALVVVPATANVIGKMAHGIADDFLTTMYLAFDGRVIVAPAMNVVMWRHAAVRGNVEVLKERGVRFVEPGAGYLACGMEGAGRLAALGEIVRAVREAVAGEAQDLAGEVVLVTAGGTREAIDAVRFLGNRSSGRMGSALAEEAWRRGARVVLVTASALAIPAEVEEVRVTTAAEMRDAVMTRLAEATIVLKAAAVADFRPVHAVDGKMTRGGRWTLELEATKDIVAEVVQRKQPGTAVVAFAAEVEDAVARGREKMRRKGVDAIVVNDVSHAGLGFDSERNAGTMLMGERTVEIPEMTKREMARVILDEVVKLRQGLHSLKVNRGFLR
jgi:phosphopantothenoylcysteine decarboxylase/phosphopantothenate--cysteine ligase